MRVFASLTFVFVMVGGGLAQSEQCVSAQFAIKVKGDEAYAKDIGSSLQLRLVPLRGRWGWNVSVSPESDHSQDWTFPVNMPLRTGEAQLLGTGYGSTVKERLRQHRNPVHVLLNKSDFTTYSRLAIQTLESRDPSAAGTYLAEISKATTGLIDIIPLASETSSDGMQVDWARLRFRVTVPNSFVKDSKLNWSPLVCPPEMSRTRR